MRGRFLVPNTHLRYCTRDATLWKLKTKREAYSQESICDSVEIENYSVAYFNCITVFEVPYCWTSIKGGVHTCLVDAWLVNESTKCVWAPPLMKLSDTYGALNTAMQYIEIRNGIYLNLRFLHGTATYVHMFEAFHTFRSCLLLFRTKPSALQKKLYGSLKKSGANVHLETFTNDGVIF